MKRILFALMLALASSSFLLAQQHVTPTAEKNTEDEEIPYTVISTTGTDTLSSEKARSVDYPQKNNSSHSFPFGDNFDNSVASEILIPLVAIVMALGLPMFIVFIAFYFRYKNRKAQYHLAEQALAAGQPLPPDFFKSHSSSDLGSQGIKNICLGIGLFIFLWAITDEFSIGTIGILVMFTGIGQWLVDRKHRKDTQNNNEGK